MNGSTSVLLVDDHVILRRALRLLIDDEPDLQVVGEAGDGAEAVRLALQLHPDIIVMDITMPVMDGVQATSEICKRAPDIAVLVLSMHTEQNFLDKAIGAGAKGYVFKNATELDLISAIRNVSEGRRFQTNHL